MIHAILAAGLLQHANAPQQPLRPPNGTYVYAMNAGGKVAFTSTIVVSGSGAHFTISERTKLPNGAVATTQSTWSSATVLPLTFEVRQGKIDLRAKITPASMKLTGMKVSFARIPGTGYVIPSVGLIANSLMLPYALSAHPGESLTLAELQNNQTVPIRPDTASPPPAPAGDTAIAVIKNKRHGDNTDLEHIVVFLNRKTGVMDGGYALPGDAKIVLRSFTPSG